VTKHKGADRYPHVFQPLSLGPVEVANRIYMSPHGVPFEAPVPGHETHHLPAAEHAHYFAERAAAGVGLIFHSTHVGPFAMQPQLAASPGLPESVPSYRKLADMIHEHGSKIMAELWYVPWQYHRWEALGPDAPQLAPSAVQNFSLPYTRYAMRKHDIVSVLEQHATAVSHLRQAGYDGIELHVSHGAILEYFLSPYHNHRTDEYGGTLENRARFLREALEVARKQMGDEMALGIRITADQLLPGGNGEEQTAAALSHLEATGLLDFVDIDISVEPEQHYLMTTSFFMEKLHNAERVARVGAALKSLPVLATPGRVTQLGEAEQLIADGKMQMVGVVRALIADPNLVHNAQDGREEQTRPCIAINHCTGNPTGMPVFGCAVNPTAGREERWGDRTFTRATKSMRVVVVGGGPAGLEAARTAARRGHTVTLFERSEELGGGVALWARIPGREHLTSITTWWADQARQEGVVLHTGFAADVDTVLHEKPDVVIVATGSVYSRTGESGFSPRPLPGFEHQMVRGPEEVIRGEVVLTGRVVILDDEGYHTTVGTAEIAAHSAADVHLVTRYPAIGHAIGRDSRFVVSRLRSLGVTLRPNTAIEEIGDSAVRLVQLDSNQQETLENVDSVVLATMRKPVDALADALEGRVDYVYLVGDALAPRSLKEATYEGHRFARVIGEADMPRRVTDEIFRPLNTLRPAEFA
jgi:2,4-dienoyl-CoA reductase-like NADH-dependent reductase (Old Yellow Enzyme family)/thioredoxin reductase